MKKTPDQWFEEYGRSHRHPTNKLIHWICVPLIVAGLLGLLWDLPVPAAVSHVPLFNWATLLVVLAMLFYLRLSVTLALGMLVFSAAAVGLIVAYERLSIGSVWQPALAVFIVAWIGQFIGHKIEGKKPSFLQDVQFLLIGPIWLLGFIYRKAGIDY